VSVNDYIPPRNPEKKAADTLMQTSLSQMLYWATCYSLDCKHSKFMSTHRKTLMEREIAEAEALLGEEKK
jgi:hypothetical protein